MATPPRAKRHGVSLARQPVTPWHGMLLAVALAWHAIGFGLAALAMAWHAAGFGLAALPFAWHATGLGLGMA